MDRKLPFASDYMRGAHPDIIARLAETNMAATGGYGLDPYSEAAKAKIRKACACESAEVELLVGGTQTNSTVIDAMLRSYQGVIAAQTGHISTHESGAIEACGHKVLTLPHTCGKLSPDSVRGYLRDFHADENRDHMVMPGMVYISQPRSAPSTGSRCTWTARGWPTRLPALLTTSRSLIWQNTATPSTSAAPSAARCSVRLL